MAWAVFLDKFGGHAVLTADMSTERGHGSLLLTWFVHRLPHFQDTNVFKKNPAYGQHLALLYVSDSGVPMLYPCVYVNTMGMVNSMSQCPYNESLSITWVHAYTMSPCLYHKSKSSNYRNTKKTYNCKKLNILIHIFSPTRFYKKSNFQKYGNWNYRNTET